MSKRDKSTSSYLCQECGETFPRWSGQCPACKAWNALKEFTPPTEPAGRPRSPAAAARHQTWVGESVAGVQNLGEVRKGPQTPRQVLGIGELDRVLGGGLTVGSVVLLGGEPGIGKSTLLLQALDALEQQGIKTLYVTGEESLTQVAERAKRLGMDPHRLNGLAEVQVEAIVQHVAEQQAKVIVIDSIQTMYSAQSSSSPGGTTQIRECAQALTRYAKQHHCSIFIVGHVTKEGTLAGPRALEHIVDAVLYFEGEKESPFRIIRAFKNRFGAINEMGAFEMTGTGMESVDNPSALFLAADRQSSIGACVFVLQEGPRPMLIELQALMDKAAGNNPRRLTVGLEANRLAMLLAVLSRYGRVPVHDYDVFANAVGGIKAAEPAADLPLLFSLISSVRGVPLPAGLACFGEIGLTGEVRPVQRAEERIREAIKQGFSRIIVPQRNVPKALTLQPGVSVVGVRNAVEAIEQLSAWEQPNAGTGGKRGKRSAEPLD